MKYDRMLDEKSRPSDRKILRVVGKKAPLWKELRSYIANQYDHTPELVFGGKKYGWAVRYRKSGKTLLTLFPEEEAFTALIVLGKKEVSKTKDLSGKLSKRVRDTFDNATQYHDGRWLWIRPVIRADIRSIEMLMATKRKPKGGK